MHENDKKVTTIEELAEKLAYDPDRHGRGAPRPKPKPKPRPRSMSVTKTLLKGMRIPVTVNGHTTEYKVTAVRSNGKVTMRPTGKVFK